MRLVPVQEAREKLSQLIAEAYRGEVVLLTDGDKEVRLQPGALDATRPVAEKRTKGSKEDLEQDRGHAARLVFRDHSAFLSSYASSDEGLYDDAESR